MTAWAKKTSKRTLAHQEKQLAYKLLLPTFLLVFGIIILPLIANFWISVKPINLADLRPPQLIIKEKLVGSLDKIGNRAEIEYRYRNSSQKYSLYDVKFIDEIPEGVSFHKLDPLCEYDSIELLLQCKISDLEAKARGKIRLKIFLEDNFEAKFDKFKSSRPQISFNTYNVLTSLEFTFANFRRIFSASEFWIVLKTSIYYTVFGTAGALVVGLFTAQIMQKNFPGRAFVRGLILFPYVAPVIAVAFSWVVLFDPFSGAVNAMLQQMSLTSEPINFFGQRIIKINIFNFDVEIPMALSMVIIFEIWRYFPLSFLFILARIQAIPIDIYEAAEIDGASPTQQFFYLSLPQIASILAVLFLLRFIWTFNKFDDIFLLTGGNAGTRTLTVNVYEQAFAISNLGAGAAVAVIIFLFLLIFSILFIKFSPKEPN